MHVSLSLCMILVLPKRPAQKQVTLASKVCHFFVFLVKLELCVVTHFLLQNFTVSEQTPDSVKSSDRARSLPQNILLLS